MYSGQSFKFKGLCVVVHPINWVMYSNPALKIIGLFVVVHPINWDTSHTIQYIRIHHRQSNILGYIRGNPLFADNPIHWNALENDPILSHFFKNVTLSCPTGGMLPRAACHWLTKSEFASYWLTQSATYSILPPAQASCCSTLHMLSCYIVRGTVRHKFALTFRTEI